MKKILTVALVGLAFSNASHAAIYNFEYTARVSKVEEETHFNTTRTSVNSSSVAGGTISIGDRITGVISYDSNAPISTRHVDGSAVSISYGYLDSLELSANFAAAGIHFEPNSYKWGYTFYGHTDPALINSFSAGTYRYSFIPGGSMTQETASFQFGDSTGTKIGDALPGAEAAGFDSNWLHYQLLNNGNAEGVYVTADFTGMKFTQAVPEPETYAMLLVGLAAIGWRRRKTINA